MLTKEQIEEISKIIQEHVGIAIFQLTGDQPKSIDIQKLRTAGIIDVTVPDSAIADAYLFGVLSSLDPAIVSAPFAAIKETIRGLPLSTIEKASVAWLKDSAALYCQGLGNRIEAATMRIVQDAAKESAMQEIIQDTMSQAARERKTRSETITLLRRATNDVQRDWHRIVNTELHSARTHGIAHGIAKQFGDDSHVIVRPHPDCCDLCRSAYTYMGKPRVFKLSELAARSNIDRKVTELKAAPGLPPLHPHCYEKTTEVYTEHGFKFIKDVEVGEKCLSLNPDTQMLELVSVVNTISHFAEKLIRFRSTSFDLAVTPEHQMFYYKGWSYKQGRIVPNYIDAKDLPKGAVIPRTGGWKGIEPDAIEVGGYSFPKELFCKFMGWYLSEGCVTKCGPDCYQIIISQQGEKEIDLVIDLADLPVRKVWKNGSGGIGFNDSGLGKYLIEFGKSWEKFVPVEIKQLSPRFVRIFLDAFRAGDGSTRPTKGFKNGNFKDEFLYYTSSKRLADDLGELILKVGHHPSYKFDERKGMLVNHRNGVYETKTDMWRIRECRSPNAWANNLSRAEVGYNDTVHCVELEKNHTLYVRFNGKVTWSGNCLCETSYFNPEMHAFDKEGRVVFKKIGEK